MSFSLSSWESSQWWESCRHDPRCSRPESARWRTAISWTWKGRMQWYGGSWWLWGWVLDVHTHKPPQLEGLFRNRRRQQSSLVLYLRKPWQFTLASNSERKENIWSPRR
jgi:hypothetical protein